jgi:hypothetical protein
MPQPAQSSSEISALLESFNQIAWTPVLTLGQYLMHSVLHFLVWQRSFRTAAIRMVLSNMEP